MDQTWSWYGLNNSTKSFLLFGIVTLQWKFEPFQTSRSKDIVYIAKNEPSIAKTWSQYDPNKSTLSSILLFGMHVSLVKFWFISVIYYRNSQNMALIWPKHGPYIIPIIWHWIVCFFLACMSPFGEILRHFSHVETKIL